MEKIQLPSSLKSKTTEMYDEIELTADEIKECLRLARKAKYTRIKEQAYWDELRKPKEYPKFTAEQWHAIMLKRASMLQPRFTNDDDFKDILWKLCLYFTNDERFNTDEYNLEKGLLIMGNVGVGKSFLMELFIENQRRSFSIIPTRKVSEAYQAYTKDKDKSGIHALAKYKHWYKPIAVSEFGHTDFGICFDDLGAEETNTKSFGNEMNAMANILYERFEVQALHGATFITTNLTGDEIEEVYGTRLRSRIRGMCNIIKFNKECKDRRI